MFRSVLTFLLALLLSLGCIMQSDAAAPRLVPLEPMTWIAEDLVDREACNGAFIPMATGQSETFLTDGLVVLRNGERAFEYYDGVFDAQKPHPLWSASKSVTATLLGMAVQSGAVVNGPPLTLDLGIARILGDVRTDAWQARDAADFSDITLGHLIEMTSGFEWDESYESAVSDSSVLAMLYRDGARDMALFALNQPLVAAHGTRWNYSGGNANIVMAALRHALGDRYDRMPWDFLSEPLGLKGPMVVEQDQSGTFVGSSYVYMTPRDMARFGQLYLDGGIADGRRLLPAGWVEAARALVPAQTRLELGADYVDYINREGLYSRRGFWLNLDVTGLAKQFPTAPDDMFFAAGHYGQLIIMLPSHRLVIARTGHDAEYWSRIDTFVSRAVACFAD